MAPIDIYPEIAMKWSDGINTITGTADVVLLSDDEINVIDLKTGRVKVEDPNRNWQGIAYAVMANAKFPGRSTVRVTFWDFRHRVMRTSEFTQAHLREFEIELSDIMQEARKLGAGYNPGEHCQYCPGNRTCPAFVRTITPILTGGEIASVYDLTPEQRGELVAKVKAAGKMLEGIEADLKACADVEPIPMPDGSVWGPVESNGKTIIDPQLGNEILGEYLGDDAWKAVDIRVTKAKEIVRDRADAMGYPSKVAAERDFMSALDGVGAVERTKIKKYQKRKKEIEHE